MISLLLAVLMPVFIVGAVAGLTAAIMYPLSWILGWLYAGPPRGAFSALVVRRLVAMNKKQVNKAMTPEILRQAVKGSVTKLDPRYMLKNPVMFVVEVGCFITLILAIFPALFGDEMRANLGAYNIIVCIVLLVTVLFSNFAESVAEGRGKAQAASLKKTQKDSEYPAGFLDHYLPNCRGNPLSYCCLLRCKAADLYPDCPGGMPDTHHNWRSAVGNWDCWHGPGHPL